MLSSRGCLTSGDDDVHGGEEVWLLEASIAANSIRPGILQFRLVHTRAGVGESEHHQRLVLTLVGTTGGAADRAWSVFRSQPLVSADHPLTVLCHGRPTGR